MSRAAHRRLSLVAPGEPPRLQPARLPSDAEILEGLLRGDAKAALALCERLSPTVDRTLVRVLGRRESDHEDLMQNAFEQILQTLIRGRFAGACSLASWAAAITSHIGLNAVRSRRLQRRVFSPEPSELPARSSVGDLRLDLDVRRELDAVREHLAAMEPCKAETLFLHDALGHELAEIAVMMGVSVPAAQSRLVRGRKELQGRLEAEDRELP